MDSVRSSIKTFLLALMFAVALTWGMLLWPLIYSPSGFGFQ